MNRFCLAVVLVVVATASVPAYGAGSGSRVTAPDRAVLARINALRGAHGLHPLTLSHQLEAAAAEHSREMVADGYFGHNSADGTSSTARIRRYYPRGKYTHWSTGENLLWASPTISAVAALRAWVASPSHLANLLDPGWRQIGIAVVRSASAPGFYRHRRVTVITTDFGLRR